MVTRVASCSCGALTASCEGEPTRISLCHCLECQKRTGSAFGLNATWPVDRVRIEGASSGYTRSSDEGFWGRHYFCPRCGTVLYWEIERRPGMVSVAVGCFADRDFPEPTISVYSHRARPWIRFETAEPLSRE
jgi:hypothetical protein